MSDGSKGSFSASLLSLQLQLKTLLEGVGGGDMQRLLDSLGDLNSPEQGLIIKVFTQVTERIAQSKNRFVPQSDQSIKQFEDTLYRELLTAMREAAFPPIRPLSVLNGGRDQKNGCIDLAERRKVKGLREKPVLN